MVTRRSESHVTPESTHPFSRSSRELPSSSDAIYIQAAGIYSKHIMYDVVFSDYHSQQQRFGGIHIQDTLRGIKLYLPNMVMEYELFWERRVLSVSAVFQSVL